MALHDPIPADEQLTKLITARHQAIEADILAGRRATVSAVAELTGERLGDESLNCDIDEAEALVRAAVIGRVVLVGERIYCIVQRAVYEHAMKLAEADLADMDRSRRESADEQRIERALDAATV